MDSDVLRFRVASPRGGTWYASETMAFPDFSRMSLRSPLELSPADATCVVQRIPAPENLEPRDHRRQSTADNSDPTLDLGPRRGRNHTCEPAPIGYTAGNAGAARSARSAKSVAAGFSWLARVSAATLSLWSAKRTILLEVSPRSNARSRGKLIESLHGTPALRVRGR